jgi:hypothetical protein
MVMDSAFVMPMYVVDLVGGGGGVLFGCGIGCAEMDGSVMESVSRI